MKDNSYFTKLTYEHKLYDNNYTYVVSITEPAWDLNGADMMKMFYKVWISAGYCPEGFTQQCEEWVEEYKEDDK